jgi:hypothetical protein
MLFVPFSALQSDHQVIVYLLESGSSAPREAGYLDRVLQEGAARVAPIANDTVRFVEERIGPYTGKS